MATVIPMRGLLFGTALLVAWQSPLVVVGWSGPRFAPKARQLARLPRAERFARRQVSALLDAGLGPRSLFLEAGRPQARRQRPLRRKDRGTAGMDAFDQLVESFRPLQPFRGYRAIGVQHLLPDTAALIEGIAQTGAGKANVELMGKTYSQDHRMIARGRGRGYALWDAEYESALDIRFGWPGAGCSAKNNRIPELLRYLDKVTGYDPVSGKQAKPKQRFVVFDDGGELTELIHKHYPQLHGRIVAVEQTRKGIRRIEAFKDELRFPVVNMAESMAKLRYESRLIGRDLAKATDGRIKRLRAQQVVAGDTILLIGYGAVGTATARSLKRIGYEVEVFDTSAAARRRATRMGLKVHSSLGAALKNSRVVLSTTGKTSLDSAALEQLPDGAVVMNGASSATELLPSLSTLMIMQQKPSGYGWQGTFRGRPFEMGGQRINWGAPAGQDWVIHLPSGKELLLVNQGQPVNFDGKRQGITPRYSQLIRGLLYLGGVQAVHTSTPGIHALWQSPQRSFLGAIGRQLRRTGESLTRPAF